MEDASYLVEIRHQFHQVASVKGDWLRSALGRRFRFDNEYSDHCNTFALQLQQLMYSTKTQ